MGNPAAAISPRLRAAVTRALHPGFFFVNIGANDGVSNDPIYPFLREHAWRGIVVEPFAPLLEELRSNYRDFSGIIFEQAAIAAAPRPFYYLPVSSGYERTWTKQVGTLNPASLVKTIGLMRAHEFDGPVPAGLEQSVASVEVTCLTFDALMEKHRVERGDALGLEVVSSNHDIAC